MQKDEALALSAKIGQSLLLQINEIKCRNRELKTQLEDAVEQVQHHHQHCAVSRVPTELESQGINLVREKLGILLVVWKNDVYHPICVLFIL